MRALTLSISLIASPAFALEIDTCAGFGNLHQYLSCTTNEDVTVTMYLPQSGTGQAYIFTSDGGSWSGPYVGPGLPSTLTNAETGEQIVLVITEIKTTKTVNMGRLHTVVSHWTLISGTLQR